MAEAVTVKTKLPDVIFKQFLVLGAEGGAISLGAFNIPVSSKESVVTSPLPLTHATRSLLWMARSACSLESDPSLPAKTVLECFLCRSAEAVEDEGGEAEGEGQGGALRQFFAEEKG